jgi:adenylate cyclase
MTSDAAKVAQVVTCLLSNACKFTERGQITLSVWREGGFVVFVVADTGIGLETSELQDVFTDFWQADGSPTRRHEGTGVGLAISRRLARLLGGEISVRSRKGEGSTFMARFAAEMPVIPPLAHSDAMH